MTRTKAVTLSQRTIPLSDPGLTMHVPDYESQPRYTLEILVLLATRGPMAFTQLYDHFSGQTDRDSGADLSVYSDVAASIHELEGIRMIVWTEQGQYTLCEETTLGDDLGSIVGAT